MEQIKISYAALKSYRDYVKGNKDEDEIMLRLRLLRDYLVAPISYTNDKEELRLYGNLHIHKVKEDNVIDRIYNKKTKWNFTNQEEFSVIQRKAKLLEEDLGITYLEQNGYYIDGYQISARAYKNYIYEVEFKRYDDLLKECIEVIKNGEIVRVYNDKKYYKWNDILVTLTLESDITNIKIGGNFYEN